MAFVAVLMCVNFASCSSSEENVPEPSKEQKKYTVSLGFCGEVLDVNYAPMSRADESDLYGIQVYSTSDENAGYTPYAFGLFDSVEGVTIGLLADKKYKFVVTLLKEGKNILAYYGHYYRVPFDISDPYKVGTPLNSFTFSSDCYFTTLSTGRTELNFGSYYYGHPTADRYYGELSDYVPTEDAEVNIEMKRVVFGVKYIVEGMDEGKLKVLMTDAPELEIESPATSTDDIIYTFASASEAYYNSDNYQETIGISFVWIKGEEEIPQGDYEFTFKRKQITTITLKVSDEIINNKGVGIETEAGGLTNGDNKTVENGQVVNTPVNPAP